MSEAPVFTPSQFVAVTNQTLETALSGVLIVGEVASFKTNQGKWVFFDLKDKETSVPCFMPIWNLRVPLEDGMKIVIRGEPKVTKWGKFSVTVTAVKPVGEGSLKKAYELLKKKLAAEGLFDPAKKRKLPERITRLGVISSTQAAGYADFIKILNARWGGMKVLTAHTQVQGMEAPDQIIRALRYFNERAEVEVIAILRGGGSADDLAAFNDEKLVREIAASKIPVITGIGHEVDESLADLAADVRASTPSNAAEMLTHDREAERRKLKMMVNGAGRDLLGKILTMQEANVLKIKKVSQGLVSQYINPMTMKVDETKKKMREKIVTEYRLAENDLRQKMKTLEVLNPERVLKQGYAIISGKGSPGFGVGDVVKITTFEKELKAKIEEVYEREK